MNTSTLDKVKIITKRIAKWVFSILGVFSFLLLLLSFTDIPYYAYHWLGTSTTKETHSPDVIVLLGGSGMPSPDGLIRTYYTAEAAHQYKNARIIIAHPYGANDSLHQLKLMANELILKGIDSARIQFAPLGFNTRSQAVNVADICGSQKNKLAVLLITSPEHMYRSVKTFVKLGFGDVDGIPAFEIPIDEEQVKDKEHAKDTRVKNLSLRYNMWSYLNYELVVLREYCAITYYKIKGWI